MLNTPGQEEAGAAASEALRDKKTSALDQLMKLAAEAPPNDQPWPRDTVNTTKESDKASVFKKTKTKEKGRDIQ